MLQNPYDIGDVKRQEYLTAIEENTNELRYDRIGTITNLNPLPGSDSASRGAMYATHSTQHLVIEGSTYPGCFTGVDRNYNEGTFKDKFNTNALVTDVIHKYPRTIGRYSINGAYNPETTIIFEDLEGRKDSVYALDVLQSRTYFSNHQKFGYMTVKTKNAKRLEQSMLFKKGDVIARSPSARENGMYTPGIDIPTMFASDVGVTEDGTVVSEEILQELAFTSIEKRMEQWGKKRIPLNMYGKEGDDNDYRIFPDIGDVVRDDCVLMAFRTIDSRNAVTGMSKNALRKYDPIFDKVVYAPPGARVVDIQIIKSNNTQLFTPETMVEQADAYYQAQCKYYSKIVEAYTSKKRNARDIRLSNDLNILIVEAMKHQKLQSSSIVKTYRGVPVDEWTVIITLATRVVPTIGFKITDRHGGKSVICSIRPRAEMPLTKDGVHADIITDGDSTTKRTNIGRLHEQWYNAAALHVTKQIRENFNKDHDYVKAFHAYYDYISTVSPFYAKVVDETVANDPERVKSVIDGIINDRIYNFIRTDTPGVGAGITRKIKEKYYDNTDDPITYDQVSFIGRDGVRKVTTERVLIAPIYWMLLEKTGDGWAAVDTAKRQHYGLLAKINNVDKYSNPYRRSSTRGVGEAENRLISAVAGSSVAADMIEFANSPASTKESVLNILKAEDPGDIDLAYIRKGNEGSNIASRSKSFVSNLMSCFGIKFWRE